MADLKSKLEAPRAFFDPVERHQLIRDLAAMHKFIRRQGWIQNMSGPPGGPRCLRSSIFEVIEGSCVGAEFNARVQRVISALGFSTGRELVGFNDAKGRTKDQVLARIDAALRDVAHG